MDDPRSIDPNRSTYPASVREALFAAEDEWSRRVAGHATRLQRENELAEATFKATVAENRRIFEEAIKPDLEWLADRHAQIKSSVPRE